MFNKVLLQGYLYKRKLRKPFTEFYRKSYELISKNVELKTHLRYGPSLFSLICSLLLKDLSFIFILLDGLLEPECHQEVSVQN